MGKSWKEKPNKIQRIINGIRCNTFRIYPYEPNGIGRGKNIEFQRNNNLCFDKLCSLLKEITIEDYEHSLENCDSKIKTKCLHIFYHEYCLLDVLEQKKN